MKHEYKKVNMLVLIGAMLLTACGTNSDMYASSAAAETSEEVQIEQSADSVSSATSKGASSSKDSSASKDSSSSNDEAKDASDGETADTKDYFTERDLSGEVDTSEAITITLKNNSISADSDNVSVDGSTVTIKEEGTYIVSGSLDDGNIIVDAGEDAKVQLVLSGVSITSKTFAPIYVVQADKVFVTLADGSQNVLTNGGSFTQIDDNNVDAVIFSKSDLTLNGSGTLEIQSPAGHGIVGKDDVTITDGTYTITAAQTAIRANDSIAVAGGSFTIDAESDGFHAENNDDDSLGYIYIQDGEFNIDAEDDGIHATTTLVIDGGDFDIQAAEGLEATNITINDGDISIEASDDGINAGNKSSANSVKVTINGGDIEVTMGSGDTDGVDSNGDIEINGGTIEVTGNSTFDYDGSGVINGGTVIANGEEITSLPNQTMGGGHGNMGGGPGNNGGSGKMGGGPGNMSGSPSDNGSSGNTGSGSSQASSSL